MLPSGTVMWSANRVFRPNIGLPHVLQTPLVTSESVPDL